MGRIVIGLALLVCSALGVRADSVSELKSGDFTFQVAVRAQANLIYHVDCLSRAVSCTSEVFEQLWREQLQLGADDRPLLNEWAAMRNELAQTGGNRSLKIKASVPIIGSGDDLPFSKMRYAGFLGEDLGSLERDWSLVMTPAKAARSVEILKHFRPRFETWWREHEAEATSFNPGVESALRKARAPELLRAAAKFYGSELGDRRLFIHLFLQPKTQRPNSQAHLVGPHLAVEIEPNENPDERVDVIVHELAHHVFARMPAERRARFADAMVASGLAGPPAWNLFDEVQATAIGNILAGRNAKSPESFKRRLDSPRGFYNDDAIDLGARASEQLFNKALKKGRAMPAAFASDFVAALQAGMGDKLATPTLYLRSMIMNVADDDSPWFRKFRRALRPSSTWGISPLGGDNLIEALDRHVGVSVAVVARPDQVSQLASAAKALGVGPEELSQALGASRGVLFVARRSPFAFSFVFLGRDDDTIDGLLAAFPVCQLKAGACMLIN